MTNVEWENENNAELRMSNEVNGELRMMNVELKCNALRCLFGIRHSTFDIKRDS
jgi:hypothetical protein